jgi:hypothetical protein
MEVERDRQFRNKVLTRISPPPLLPPYFPCLSFVHLYFQRYKARGEGRKFMWSFIINILHIIFYKLNQEGQNRQNTVNLGENEMFTECLLDDEIVEKY